MQLYHPKTTSGALGGALSVIILMELSRRGLPIDAAEGGAITLILTWACGYIAPDSDVTQSELDAAKDHLYIPPPVVTRARNASLPSTDPEIETLRATGVDDLSIPPRPAAVAAETAKPTPEEVAAAQAKAAVGGPVAGVVAATLLFILSACAPLNSALPPAVQPGVAAAETRLTQDAKAACTAQSLFNSATAITASIASAFVGPGAVPLGTLASQVVGAGCTWVNAQP